MNISDSAHERSLSKLGRDGMRASLPVRIKYKVSALRADASTQTIRTWRHVLLIIMHSAQLSCSTENQLSWFDVVQFSVSKDFEFA